VNGAAGSRTAHVRFFASLGVLVGAGLLLVRVEPAGFDAWAVSFGTWQASHPSMLASRGLIGAFAGLVVGLVGIAWVAAVTLARAVANVSTVATRPDGAGASRLGLGRFLGPLIATAVPVVLLWAVVPVVASVVTFDTVGLAAIAAIAAWLASIALARRFGGRAAGVTRS
jgi:hypothetical protein